MLASLTLKQALASVGAFTVLILGMGDDGHTASLFPGADALPLGSGYEFWANLHCGHANCAPHQRISMTLPRLLDSQQIIIHISGAGKQQVLEEAKCRR